MPIKIDDFKDTEQVFADIKKYMIYNYSNIKTIGNIVEFGVYKGATLNHIADIIAPSVVYGFDSFDGLPEKWEMSETVSVAAGMFNTKELPKVRKNAELIVGLFNESLHTWLAEHPTSNIAMAHIDCDIYSSTHTVLEILNSRFKVGTVLIFDDLYPWQDEDDYPYWRRGQWKALKEWEKESGREIEVISRMRRRHSGAVIITK